MFKHLYIFLCLRKMSYMFFQSDYFKESSICLSELFLEPILFAVTTLNLKPLNFLMLKDSFSQLANLSYIANKHFFFF